jgi:hypothetical protein
MDHLKQTILCVATSVGKTHDFALFKKTRLAIAPHIELLADTGYQGLDKLHPNSQTPHKKSKHHPLTPEQKQHNKNNTTKTTQQRTGFTARHCGTRAALPQTVSHPQQHLSKPQKTLWTATQLARRHRKPPQLNYARGLIDPSLCSG